MVKIVIAGGSGSIAREIVDVLVATNKHEILILSRKDPTAAEQIPGVTLVQTDYENKTQLVSILTGVHTVLSFISSRTDAEGEIQKAFIDAIVAAGVKRFAPNEWGSSTTEELPWYAEKGKIRTYLEEINKEKKVLEYTLFQPGLLVDMLAPEGSSSKYLKSQELFIDFSKRRAIILSGKESCFSLSTMNDVANVVARAVEYEGEWPVIGGMRGSTITGTELLEIGAKARGGKSFDVISLKEEDVRAGTINSWIPQYNDPSISSEQVEVFSKIILTGSLLSGICGSWVVSDEWNRLMPDYKFTGTEEFLVKHWAGKS